jgi:protein tyrosine/serine phosphatase
MTVEVWQMANNLRPPLPLAAVILTLASILLSAPSFGQTPSAATDSVEKPAASAAKKLRVSGLPNFGQVTEHRYRGGQPTSVGLEKLNELGIDIIVNFRNEPQKIESERSRMDSLGVRYVSIPWRGKDDPNDIQVAAFLRLLRENPEKKVFVHCQCGSERTGVMSAAFRILEQGWTPTQALQEMETFGFRGFWVRHLKKLCQADGRAT